MHMHFIAVDFLFSDVHVWLFDPACSSKCLKESAHSGTIDVRKGGPSDADGRRARAFIERHGVLMHCKALLYSGC